MSVRRIPCPNCGGPASAAESNPWRPFCSRRCKLIDLGDWLSEEHRIPDRDGEEADGEPWEPPGDRET